MGKRQRLGTHQKSSLYTGHLALAKHLAMGVARSLKVNYQDAETEAISLLGEIIACWSDSGSRGYNPTRCNPTSWIYRSLYWGLRTHFLRKVGRRMRPATDIDPEGTCIVRAAPPLSWVERLVHNLGADARTLVAIILNAPADLHEILTARRPRRSRDAVRQYLTNQGWSPERVAHAWAEVEEAL